MNCSNATIGEVTVDFEWWRVTRRGREVHLTVQEFRLLKLLYLNRGKVVTRSQLSRLLWGANAEGIKSRALDSQVYRLRRKLRLKVEAVDKIGYRLPEVINR